MNIEPSVRTVKGFSWFGKNIGIKDSSLDFGGILASEPCSAAAVFTTHQFPGAPIIVGRDHINNGTLQAVIVNSKNANAATGQRGIRDCQTMCRWLGNELEVDSRNIFPSSTGVIGVPMPMDILKEGISGLKDDFNEDLQYIENFAQSIMTTDTYPKWVSAKVGSVSIMGVAKGSGMIEPNMATMLAYFITDAEIPSDTLQSILNRVVDKSFNRLSIDGDMSTSDTVLMMASGKASSPVKLDKFEAALEEMANYLSREIIRDGEGVQKIIDLTVTGTQTSEDAVRLGKLVINSPLVKTAVHGADPNWGRLIMALGKQSDIPIDLDRVNIHFGHPSGHRVTINVKESLAGDLDHKALSRVMKQSEVFIEIVVGRGSASERVLGCDLSAEYVRINSEYTT